MRKVITILRDVALVELYTEPSLVDISVVLMFALVGPKPSIR